LAWLQAIIAGFHTLQYLHILPFVLGPMSFFTFDLLGALLRGLTSAIYIWAGLLLWRLDERGWMFAVLLAGWVLILDILELFGLTSWQSVLPSRLVSAAVLIYGLLPSTREAFENSRSRSTLAT
jgi:hypothetical protein